MSAGLPNLAALGAQVADKLEKPHRSRYERLLVDHNLEDLLSHVRLTRSLLAGSRNRFDGLNADTAASLDRAITRAIARIVAGAPGGKLSAHERLASWLGRSLHSGPIEVFTTNYDVLLEQAFESRGVPYFDGFVGIFEAEFRADLVEQDDAMPDTRLPAGWIRLWKLHGSVSWVVEGSPGSRRIVRRGQWPVADPDAMLAIYPTTEKYEESRRMPFLALSDRLRRSLASPESTTLVVGYSFGDQHINELIFTAVERYQRSEVIAVFRGEIPESVAEQAGRFANLSAFGATEAILRGERGRYISTAVSPGWDGSRMQIGDFGTLTEVLSRTGSDVATAATT
jgi:hypothetical protein